MSNLYAEAVEPYIYCKASNTKNRKQAKLPIDRILANHLADLVATKIPKAPIFSMPHRFDVAGMLRDDLADARRMWLDEAADDLERREREQSDFLLEENDRGQKLDFHALRHTSGAWLTMQGASPQMVQKAMRHSTITLSMETYGHLSPAEEAKAAKSMSKLLAPKPTQTEVAKATGTDDRVIPIKGKTSVPKLQQILQQSECDTQQERAKGCGKEKKKSTRRKSRNPKQDATLSDHIRSKSERRTRDSNPQPLAGHLISSQAASQFAYPPG